jgi:four helix bundle protein
MQDFKKLRVWENAHRLVIEIYCETRIFPREEQFGITAQIRRSASAIAANIAEGCRKNGGSEFARYLNIALGSANETEYFLILSKDLGYLSNEKANPYLDNINEIKAMLIRLINRVRNQPDQ